MQNQVQSRGRTWVDIPYGDDLRIQVSTMGNGGSGGSGRTNTNFDKHGNPVTDDNGNPINPGGGFHWNIPWINLGNTSTGAGTALFNTTQNSVTVDAASPGVFDRGSVDDFGEPAQSYTGPQVACNLHLVIAGIGAIGFTITILQDGNPILGPQSVTNAAGTFDFPFNVLAGVNSQVLLSFLEVYSTGGGNVHVEATLSP